MTNQDRSPISPDALERLEGLSANPKFICRMNGKEAEEFAAALVEILSERKALIETLEPFAQYARDYPSHGPDEAIVCGWKPDHEVRLADFRRAASILGEPKP